MTRSGLDYRMRSRVVVVALLVAFGVSCSGTPDLISVNQLPATVQLALGQDLHITSPDLTIRVLEVVDDSRCPVDVVCVVAGTVNLRFDVRQAGMLEGGFFLKLGETNADFGVRLRVAAVAPERRTTVPVIPAKDYRVTLVISPL